ncbi:MAG: zinc-dependent metalloprotease family protein [Phormidesmis sp.]
MKDSVSLNGLFKLGQNFCTPKPLHLFLGLSLALVGCSESSVQSPQTIDFDTANELLIQPIRVCNDIGQRCARVNLFEEITAKILEQAMLKVTFLPTNQLNATRFLSINDSSQRNTLDYEFYELARTGDAGAFGRHPDSTRTSGPINVWFVDEIESSSPFVQYGLAWVDANGVLISSAALDFGANGRTDTVAHEVGHNLGLRHSTLGAGGPNNLLTDGNGRNIPSTVADIGPNGAGVSTLTDAQIKEILDSPFLVSNSSNPAGNVDVTDADAADIVVFPHTLSPQSAPAQFAASVPEPTSWLGITAVGLALLTLTRRDSTVRS